MNTNHASSHVTVVNGAALPWVNGACVYDTMEPAFRDNIGHDKDAALKLLSRYNMRSLWLDPITSRRIDHVRADAGYIDLSEAYHDSVEECFFLGGEVELSAEGRFVTGDYFWRPPGWVHSAASQKGFEAILMMEGEEPTEASHRVSRVVRPDEDAGHQGRPDDLGRLGPRGYVRRAETRFMPWSRETKLASGLGVEGLRTKRLSENVETLASSVLVQTPAGWRCETKPSERDRFVVNSGGCLVVDGEELVETSLVHIPAGMASPVMSTPAGAELFVKAGRAQ